MKIIVAVLVMNQQEVTQQFLNELQELSYVDLQPDDLFYVVDTSTNVLEGKKILVVIHANNTIPFSWTS
jgi:hypothetical protein